MAKRNPHIGSDFDDFLSDEGLLEVTTALAIKRVIAWQLDEERILDQQPVPAYSPAC